jgi:biopolymer transport protein ExbB/biopolymer transport protein TolQ
MVKWNWVELWKSMSPLGHLVVMVLVVMFLRSFVVTINRLMRYRLARVHSQNYIQQSLVPFREGKIEQAISAAEVNRKSHIASVVCAGLLDYQSASASLPDPQIIESVERSLERSSAETQEEMKRGLSGLATIAATAPFVGLFGTVIGILNAFSNISGAHAVVMKVIAGSISEALLTTAIGLSVAVPAVWCYNYLTSQMDLFGVEMRNSALELVSYLRTRQAECVKR